MFQTKISPITRVDYEAMPDGPPYFQVIEGTLVSSPSPKLFHQYIAGNIFRIIANYLENHAIGEVIIAPFDVFLSDANIYQPDVVFIAKERLSILTDKGIEGGPDLVVEILSASTAKYDKGTKRKVYARAGVQELWLIDPDSRTIEVFQFNKNPERPTATHKESMVFSSPLLPGLTFEGQKVFRNPTRLR